MNNDAGSIRPEFQDHIATLKQQGVREGVRTAAVFVPGTIVVLPGGTIGRDEIAATTGAFSRDSIDAAYLKAVTDGSAPGTLADAASLKFQNDLIAARERAHRLASRSAVRSRVHSVLRRKGMGSEAGPIAAIDRYVGGILLAGKES